MMRSIRSQYLRHPDESGQKTICLGAQNLNRPTRFTLCNGRHVAAPVSELLHEPRNGIDEAGQKQIRPQEPEDFQGLIMVGVARIELATPAMSTQCSTTELHAHGSCANSGGWWGVQARNLFKC